MATDTLEAPPAPDDSIADPALTPAEWHAILAVEGKSTGSRTFALGAFTWRTLPISLVVDHEGVMVVVGRVDTIIRDGARLIGTGVWDQGELGQKVAAYVQAGTVRWVSAEPDETYESILVDNRDHSPIVDWDEIEPNTDIEELVSAFRICAMSVVTAGALEDCVICPIDQPLPEATSAEVAPVMASVTLAVVKDEKPPIGWFTADRQGAPGSDIYEGGAFLRVEGYVAKWGVPHVGRRDRVCAPRSRYPDYPYFRQSGHVLTAGGKVPTGALTIGCGHAGDYATAEEARAHYDNAGTKWAAVAAGEDDYGIWAAGMCKPDMTRAELWSARASAWSGDWRPIAGALELVATLSVNVPGFPQVGDTGLSASAADAIILPFERTRCALRGGEPMSLVAAGISYPDPVGDHLRALADRVHRLECEMAGARVGRLRSRMTK